jgi:anti-sigma regulatory factor (Ser/Thr protein kinase)
VNTGAAFVVREAADVAAARRAASGMAAGAGLDDTRAGRAALVVTELGTNLLKHAGGGEILLRGLDPAGGDDYAGVEILALDKGPGLGDVDRSRRDGYSTTGTLGHGLGAIERQSDWCQLHTGAAGTAILSHVWREPHTRPRFPSRLQIGGVRVNMPGEHVCGDAWTARVRSGYIGVILADGLGHGLAAETAARQAIDVFGELDAGPLETLEAIHAALRATRGAAVAVAAIDPDRGVVRYCGIGNISATILAPDGAQHKMVSMNGTAGHQLGRLREFQYPMPPHYILVMHSDGVSTKWDFAAHPGLRQRHPTLIAGVLYRAAHRRDDASVLVVKDRPSA